MARVAVAVCLILCLFAQARAGETCVACDKPAATYRCTLEQPTRDAKFQVGDAVQSHVCKEVLTLSGHHGDCRILPDTEACEGVARTVTMTEYQQITAGDGHSTYRPGALEVARRSAYSTWVCVTSLFNDC